MLIKEVTRRIILDRIEYWWLILILPIEDPQLTTKFWNHSFVFVIVGRGETYSLSRGLQSLHGRKRRWFCEFVVGETQYYSLIQKALKTIFHPLEAWKMIVVNKNKFKLSVAQIGPTILNFKVYPNRSRPSQENTLISLSKVRG